MNNMKSEIEWHKIEDKKPEINRTVLGIFESIDFPMAVNFDGTFWRIANGNGRPLDSRNLKIKLWAEMPENPLVNAEVKKELIWKRVDMFDPPVDKRLLVHVGFHRTKFAYFNGKVWVYPYDDHYGIPIFWAEIPHPQ